MRYRLTKSIWGKKFLDRDQTQKNPKFVREIRGKNTYEGEFSQAFLERKNLEGYNIYFFPNGNSKKLPEGVYLNGKDVDQFDYVFVDMDLKDQVYPTKEAFLETIETFPLKPAMVNDTGNGVHVYWKISDLDPVAYMLISKLLIAKFKTDDSIWTLLQLMRAPGFLNVKDFDNPKPVQTLSSSKAVYTKDQMFQVLPKPTPEIWQDLEMHLDKLSGKVPEMFKDLEDGELPKKFEDLMEKNSYVESLFNDPKSVMDDRSKADFHLAAILLEEGFNREEAMQVLINTEKARSRNGPGRYQYAFNTLNKVYTTKSVLSAKSAAEKETHEVVDLGDPVNGPYYLDCLDSKWRRKQVLGLIGGSGVGKTEFTLSIYDQAIKNNPNNSDIFLFFNLEMTDGEVLKRWKKKTDGRPDAMKRLFIIGKNDFESLGIQPNLQSIYRIIKDTENRTGQKVSVVAIDHLDALSPDFDLNVTPTFEADRSPFMDRRLGSDGVILSKDGLCQNLKRMAQMLDVFLIVQSQTTKEKDGGGDIPIDKNAAYGSSKFEWYFDYIIGIWRPLKRIMEDCIIHGLFVTAFKYCKMREENPEKDEIRIEEAQLLKYNPKNGDFVGLNDDDYRTFNELVEKANQIREIQKKHQGRKYFRPPIGPVSVTQTSGGGMDDFEP